MGDYYPSAKVRLRVRFEDFGADVLKDKAPKKSIPRLKGVKDERAPLKVVPDPDSPDDGVRWLLVAADDPKTSSTTSGSPQAQTASADGFTHEVSGLIPKSAKWARNSFRQADTLSLSLRWSDFPIDPRTIRSCAVMFYLGTTSAQEHAAGIMGLSRGGVGRGAGGAEALNVVPDTYLDPQGRQRTNLRFEGWADKWKMSWSDDEPVVELECTDNTRLFLKQSRAPRLIVGMERPIDEAVAEYLSHFPQFRGLSVEYRPLSATQPPKLKTVLAGTAFVPDMGPPAQGGGGEPENVWDYLTRVCGAIALMIRVEGTTVIIQGRADAMGTGPVSRLDDPYQGRNLDGSRYDARAFIFGRNVASLTMEREYVRKEAKNIEVRAWDSHRKTVLVARYPDKAIVGSPPGDGKADKDFSVHYAPIGVRDLPTLQRMAEEEYNTAGRQELTVTVKTRDLSSLGGDNLDPDLLDMQPGDAFEVLVDRRSTEASTQNEAEQQMTAAAGAEKFLRDLGYTPEFAAAYAKSKTNAGFQRLYKTKELSAEWSTDEGISVEIVGVNYITARVDKPSAETQAKVVAHREKPKQPPPTGAPALPAAVPAAPPVEFETVGQNADGSPILRKI